jgi:DNA-binding MarR family transcriptional regulator
MPMPCDATILAWTRLMRAHRAALARAEQALKDQGLPGLEWYDVLLELERAGPLRPRDLQKGLLLAQYNLSRLLDRMAEAGLIERRSCPQDGRGQFVAVTAEGRKLRQRTWPVYAGAIQSAIGARLGPAEAAELAELLGRLYVPGAPSTAAQERGPTASGGKPASRLHGRASRA